MDALSNEVLLIIFSFYLPPTPNTEEFCNDKPWLELCMIPPPQFILGSVNQRWRELVWSTPWFWDSFCFIIPWNFQSSDVTFVGEWLQRSRNLSLTLRLALAGVPRDDLKADFQTCMNSLVQVLNTSIHRWSSIFLRIPNNFLSKLRCPSGRPPPLKALIVYPSLVQFQENNVPKWMLDFGAEISPSHVIIQRGYVQDYHLSPLNLVHLQARVRGPNECVTVLRNAPRLIHCDLYIDTYPQSNLTLRPETFSSIKSLWLRGDIQLVIQQITCPSLLNLTWDLLMSSYAGYPTEFITRSRCHLESLDTAKYSINDDDLIAFLKLLPSLTKLILRQQVGKRFVQAFGQSAYTQISGNHVDRALLPNLTVLNYWGLKDFLWQELIDMFPRTPPSSDHIVCRPLVKAEFHFIYDQERVSLWDVDGAEYEVERETFQDDILPRSILEDFDAIAEAGVEICVQDEIADVNILDYWKKEYDIVGTSDT